MNTNSMFVGDLYQLKTHTKHNVSIVAHNFIGLKEYLTDRSVDIHMTEARFKNDEIALYLGKESIRNNRLPALKNFVDFYIFLSNGNKIAFSCTNEFVKYDIVESFIRIAT